MEPSGVDPQPNRLVGGDDRAIAELFDRFGQRLYRAALGMLGSREDAEDTVQEVFMAVIKSRVYRNPSQDLTGYLFTALRREAGRNAARRARAPVASEIAVQTMPDPRPAGGQDSDPYGDRLQKTLLALPAEQREVIALKIDGELTFSQIADVLGVSQNTAASRYRYALEKLRAFLDHKS